MYGATRRAAVAEWMERTGLSERRSELAGSLPGGFRKRIALACALIHRPQMLFLDEPTSGVDPVSRREFWDTIVGLADAGTTVMVTTHYLDEAEHCNQLAFIYGGHIIARGTPEAMKHAPDVGVTLEIVSKDNIALLQAVEARPYVRSASLYGSALHVTVDREQVDALRHDIAALGVDVPQIISIAPSLEDVFAVLVRRAGTAGTVGSP
jgi:ABC-2 type transport system ATP-binding protein